MGVRHSPFIQLLHSRPSWKPRTSHSLRKRMNGLRILHEIFVVLEGLFHYMPCKMHMYPDSLSLNISCPATHASKNNWKLGSQFGEVTRGDCRVTRAQQLFDLNKFQNLGKIAHTYSSHNVKLVSNRKYFVILGFSLRFQWNMFLSHDWETN